MSVTQHFFHHPIIHHETTADVEDDDGRVAFYDRFYQLPTGQCFYRLKMAEIYRQLSV